VKTAQIIKALRSTLPQANVERMIDDEIGPLVERIVTAGRSIPLIRQHLADFTYAIYVLAARTVNEAREIEERAKLDAAHDRAEAVELYRALGRAHRELDKIRFGEKPDPEVISLVGDELSRFDRPVRYADDDDE
jgi:hypothetical protein